MVRQAFAVLAGIHEFFKQVFGKRVLIGHEPFSVSTAAVIAPPVITDPPVIRGSNEGFSPPNPMPTMTPKWEAARSEVKLLTQKVGKNCEGSYNPNTKIVTVVKHNRVIFSKELLLDIDQKGLNQYVVRATSKWS